MSRSKTPNPGQGGGYDQNLLVDAPEASRAQLQEGYNVNILEGGRTQRSPSVRSPVGSATPAPPPPVPQGPLVLAAAENGSKEQFVESGGAYASKPRTGFWRSRNGTITIFVIILVVIGAVVGGAVGGTAKKAPVNSTGISNSTPSSSPSSSSTGSVGEATAVSDSSPAASGIVTSQHSPLSTESIQ
ncbi:hypothetical protein F5141DRAFT_618358 [Pisolithus sp. B1]|nr:hypothetical protein F5141DRAFT_618358 [Pisolithus sp. B1]